MELVWINGHDLRRDVRCFRTLMLSLIHDENDCDFVSL